MACYGLETSCQTIKTTTEMSTIEFFPREFQHVVLGHYESGENIFTPNYPDYHLKMRNQIAINMPQKVICSDSNFLVIPLCGAHVITGRRGLKYAHLSTPVIHVRKIGEETEYLGDMIDTNLEFEYPDFPPNYAEEEEKRQQEIAEAQNYSDNELDEGKEAYGSAINVNIVDYLNMSFQQGIYEIYLSMYGLESNRVRVEINFK
jgi:hypothetical protein